MENNFWENVERLFHSALSLPPEDREPFLQRECGNEAAILSEVNALLFSFENDDGFLDEPIFDLGLQAIGDPPRKDLSGTTINSYELEKQIGSGGMGEVYKAVDVRLNRRVALKFLTGSLENNRDARRQLVKEAQAVAMLDHPNICAVHNIEQSDESHFIVMPYVEGVTLADHIEKNTIDAGQFVSIARQIISAVAFAHAHGVIHRDLKPGNIMLTPDGTIKVLDFGLAKIIQPPALLGADRDDNISRFSQAGLIIGTVAYMSPEQLRGEKLDYRSDIFSVGVILYELIARTNPFKRESQAETIAAILNAKPYPFALPTGFTSRYKSVIETCLEKRSDDRFQSAAEILVELKDVTSDLKKHRLPFVGVVILAAALVLLVWVSTYLVGSKAPERSLAVLPISLDASLKEKEYLADGLTQIITDKLSNLTELKVKSQFFVSPYKQRPVDAQSVGKALNVDAVFVGEVAAGANTLLLKGKLARVSDGAVIEEFEIPIDESDLIGLQENIVTRIVSKVKSDLGYEDRQKLAKKDTQNPEAKRLYIFGRHFLERQEGDDLQSAIRYFTQATELDPFYAKAWTGLADTYSLIGVPGHEGIMAPKDAFTRARAAADRALEIDDTLAAAHVSRAMVKLRFDWDWDGAEAGFRKAISLEPELPPAHWGLSNLLIVKKRYNESADEAKLAKQFAPFSPIPDLSLARTYSFERNWTEMETVLNGALERFPDHKRLRYFRGLLYLRTNRLAEAREIFERIYHDDPLYAAAPLALTYRALGRRADIISILQSLDRLPKDKYVPAQEWAWVYLALSDRDEVFEHLDKACKERFSPFPGTLLDPGMDELQSDPRFLALKKCANLPG